MSSPSAERLNNHSTDRTASILIVSAGAVACAVLMGWAFEIDALKRIAPGLNWMNPMTAVCFVLSCVAMWQMKAAPASGKWRWLKVIVALFVFTVGALKLLDIQYGTSLCPDDVLFRSQLDPTPTAPGRIAPNTAICFVLLSLAILMQDSKLFMRYLHPQYLMLPIMALAFAALIGYLYKASGFYKYQQYSPMALHTATNFGMLAVALLFMRRHEGFMRFVPPGSLSARSYSHLLPACLLVPIFLGAIQLAGVERGLLTAESGASAASVVVAMAMAVLVFLNSVEIHRIEQLRNESDRQLRLNQEKDQRALQTAKTLGDLEELIRSRCDNIRGGLRDILRLLVQASGALQGALFGLKGARLHALSLYAPDHLEQLETSFAIGEGFVGQCAALQQTLRMEPPEDYFRLRSALVNQLPRHLLFMPITLDDELMGVLELAFVRTPDEETQRLLKSALRITGFALKRLQ